MMARNAGQGDLLKYVFDGMQGKVTLRDVHALAAKPSKSGAAEGRARRDRGLAKVERHVDTVLQKAARDAWDRLCQEREFLTSDDLWFNMPLEDITPDLGKVMGAIIRSSAARRQVTATGRYQKTARAAGHARAVAVWKSQTWQGRING